MDDAEAELNKELVISPSDAMTYAALGKIAANRNSDAQGRNISEEGDLARATNARRLSISWTALFQDKPFSGGGKLLFVSAFVLRRMFRAIDIKYRMRTFSWEEF